MGLKKCPRCELNYIKDDEKLCNVCKRSAKLSDETEEEEALCIECGEHPAMKGKELCAECYRESLRLNNRRKAKPGLDFEDVDDVTDVTLPDEEIPLGTLPDELEGEFDDEPQEAPKEEGEIEFTKGISLEQMEEEESEEPDDFEEIDEGFTPAKAKHR